MYKLEHFRKIGVDKWLVEISGVGPVYWTTSESKEKLRERIDIKIARLQMDYGRKFSTGKAVSHWHKIAAVGDGSGSTKEENLRRLKARRNAEIGEFVKSRGKRC